jgi:mevalonate kinase
LAVANGKVILLGEHAVVYGYPALVVGVKRGAQASVAIDGSCTIRLGDLQARAGEGDLGTAFAALMKSLNTPPLRASVDLSIPPGCGLGASAAAAVALARAALDELESTQDETPSRVKRILSAADAWEKVFHGRPSGVDATAAALGGCFVFSRRHGIEPIEPAKPLHLAVAVADSPANTRAIVAQVAEQCEAGRDRFERIFSRIEVLVRTAQSALLDGTETTLGAVMDENHQLLREIGVSTLPLDRACEIAHAAGALGAKLTGSGGGGCVVALCETTTEPILKAWRQHGLQCLSTTIAQDRPNAAGQ